MLKCSFHLLILASFVQWASPAPNTVTTFSDGSAQGSHMMPMLQSGDSSFFSSPDQPLPPLPQQMLPYGYPLLPYLYYPGFFRRPRVEVRQRVRNYARETGQVRETAYRMLPYLLRTKMYRDMMAAKKTARVHKKLTRSKN
ncbi:hypothetical protein V3C99_016906 [Haemonchus contortus]